MAFSITSANTVIIIGAVNLLPPTQVQGFATDNIYVSEQVNNSELMMGLDGFLSAGWVPMPVIFEFELMANSPSVGIFETIYAAEQSVREKYQLFGNITAPSIGRSGTWTKGFMTDYQPLASAARTMQPRRFRISVESLTQLAI